MPTGADGQATAELTALTLLGRRIGEARDVTVDLDAVTDVLEEYAEAVRQDERRKVAALSWWQRLRYRREEPR